MIRDLAHGDSDVLTEREFKIVAVWVGNKGPIANRWPVICRALDQIALSSGEVATLVDF